MGTLPNNTQGNSPLRFCFKKRWGEFYRSPRIPFMGSARRGRTRQLPIIAGRTMSSQTCSLMIGCGLIWSMGLSGSVSLIRRRLTICHCCLCFAWGSSTGRLPTIVSTRLRKQSGMVSSCSPINVKVMLDSIGTIAKVHAESTYTKVNATHCNKYNCRCYQAAGAIT